MKAQAEPTDGRNSAPVVPTDWDKVLDAAELLSRQFVRDQVDLAEAEKAGDYYVRRKCDPAAMVKYLHEMATNPPPRSRRTQRQYAALERAFSAWRPEGLGPDDRARAWGWAVRLAKASRPAQNHQNNQRRR